MPDDGVLDAAREPRESPRYLWIVAISALRWLWQPLAFRIQELTGLRPLLIVATEQDRHFYLQQPRLTIEPELIVVRPDSLEAVVTAPQPDRDGLRAVIRWAAEFERANDITLMRDFVQADRHLGRGYIVGWSNAARSHASDHANQHNILSAAKEQADFVEALWRERPAGMVITLGSGIPGKFLSLACRRQGVPMRALASGRFGNLYYWAEDEFENSASFVEAISEHRTVSVADIEAVRAELAPTTNSQVWGAAARRAANPFSAYAMAARSLVRQAYNRMRGFKRSRYGIKTLAAAGQYFRKNRDWRYLSRPPFLTLGQLPEHLKLVYYPLQKEPEASLQGQSPECANQFALILEIALSLPADALLVVKEHPIQVGGRPRDLYERVLQFPNAVMVRPTESSLELIRRSTLVCAINSSVAYEAAVLGKPVAYFSRHGPLPAVPHVQPIEGHDGLAWLREALADDPEAATERARDGARFYLAAKAYCMDLPRFSEIGRSDAPSEAELDALGAALVAGLPAPPANTRTVSRI